MTVRRNAPAAGLPIYRQALGEAFSRLPLAVQQLHNHQGRAVYVGQTETIGPRTRLAKWLAWLLGTPRHSARGPIRFELQASPFCERWSRYFPDKTMVSELTLEDGLLVERLGVTTLRFRLTATSDGLNMILVRMSFLGVPCPAILMPRIVAQETQSENAFSFNVSAHLPIAGQVVGYTGTLMLCDEGHAA